MKLLIVEDNLALQRTLYEELSGQFVVDTASTLAQAELALSISSFNCILLDITLPDGNGITFCQSLRNKGIHTPVIVVSGQNEVSSKVDALENGADDSIAKPYALAEIIARIQAVTRRNPSISPNIVTIGNVRIDLTNKQVYRDNTTLTLLRKEYDLLELLLEHINVATPRKLIWDRLWETDHEPFSNTIEVYIRHLRTKLNWTNYIQTVKNVGYILCDHPNNEP